MITSKKNGIIVSVVIMAYCIPIFMLDKPYTDDYARTIKGYFGWSNDGRPLADLLIYILNFGPNLTDIAPLSHIISLCALIFSCYIISTYIVNRDGFISSLSASILVLSPFFIHNLLYRYDSPIMAFSILCCCIPFINKLRENNLYIVASSFIMPMASLMFYQASFPLFFCLATVEYFRICRDKENKKLNTPILRCVSAGLSLIVYQLLISPFFISGDYVVNHSSPLPANIDGLKNAINNISLYINYISNVATKPWLAVFCALIVLSSISIISCVRAIGISRKLSFNLLCLAFGVFVSTIMFFMTIQPAYYARVMIGFNSIIMMLFCICCLKNEFKYNLILGFLVSLMTLIYLSAGSNILNYIKTTYNNEKQISFMLKVDMSNIAPETPIYVHGYPSRTFEAERILKKYPYASGIYHPDLGWNTTRVFAEIETPFFKAEKGTYNPPNNEICGKEIKKWNGLYTITSKDNKYHAIFRNVKC